VKKITKTLLIVLALAMLIAAASACGGPQGKLVMATNAAFPPFEYVNDDGDFDGFDVHMARAIAGKLNMELVIEDMEFTAALAAITTGQADVAIAAITIRPDRMETMDFSTPYFETTIVAIVPFDSDITSPSQLEDKRIAVQFGTTSDLFCEDYLPDAIVTSLNRAPDTVLELRNGRVDAIVVDKAVADQFIGDNPGLRILGEALGSESYGIAVQKGNSDLLGKINNALSELRSSGEYDRIFNLFFES